MIDLAEVARRSPQLEQHWILSWREGEQPTRVQADEAVGMYLAEMGLGEHQAVYALHRDTHNCHVHVAINRVHPTKGSGALLWIGEQPLKASAVGRDCSMAALRKRLSEFEPAPSTPVRVPAPSRAIDPSAPTLRIYLDARRKHLRGPRGRTSASNR
jgi:hypothetical protein